MPGALRPANGPSAGLQLACSQQSTERLLGLPCRGLLPAMSPVLCLPAGSDARQSCPPDMKVTSPMMSCTPQSTECLLGSLYSGLSPAALSILS